MAAGNAIQRMHKNVLELEISCSTRRHFPYVVFLQGSNFATRVFDVAGRMVAWLKSFSATGASEPYRPLDRQQPLSRYQPELL